jgi:Photosynthesis system II assembly factor YCF48
VLTMLRLAASAVALMFGLVPAAAHSSPSSFAILSLTYTDARHVWVLGLPCADQPACSRLVVRGGTDGGRTWPVRHAVPALPSFLGKGQSHPYVSKLRYATPRDAYAFGPALVTSHDSGKTWDWQKGIGAVEALERIGSQVWAVSDLCPRAGACPVYLYRSPTSRDAWHRSPLPLRSPAGDTQIVGETNGHVWILAYQATTGPQMSRSALIGTTTSGRAWSRLPDPCTPAESNIDRLATRDGVHLWLVCGGQPSAGGELFSLYRSPDGGRHWHIVASNDKRLGVPHFVYGGYVDSLAVTGPSTAWFSLDRGTLYETTDGGQSWRLGVHQTVSDSTVGPVLFANPSHGWLASYPNVIFRTVDGGRNWARIAIP